MKKVFKLICYPFVFIFCIFRRASYYRIIMCIFTSLLFSFSIIVPICIIASKDFDSSYTDFLKHTDEIVSNPITLVSFAGALVGIALTIVGFALNSFVKKESEEKGIFRKSVDSIMVEISMLRYNGFIKTCFFLNFFYFPILSKILSLFLLLVGMLYIALFSCFKIFYLGIITFLMCLILISVLFDVFSLYTDRNFALLNNSKLMTKKIFQRIRHLHLIDRSYKKYYLPFRQSLRLYARSDIVYGIDFVVKAMETISYCSSNQQSKVYLIKGLEKHFLVELICCSFVFTEVPLYDKALAEKETKKTIFRYIDSVFFDKEGSTLIEALKKEKNHIEKSEEYDSDEKISICRTIDDYILSYKENNK